jgi:diguanylate cyclase (GGDEF)-like protein
MAEERPKKILIVDDSEPIRNSLSALLEAENYETVVAENGKTGVEIARKEIPHLILCDVQMPELDGYGVLTELRNDPATSAIPFVFLTGRAERDQIREGMNLGADDYLTKPFRREELIRAVSARLARRAIIEDHFAVEIRVAEEKLNQLMHYDVLTGLPNRMLLREKFGPISSQNNSNGNVAVLIVGLDRFKRINETLGYSFGDILLKFVAERLVAYSSGKYPVARLTGDQFAILIPGLQMEKIVSVSNEIIETIARPFSLEAHQVFLTASLGISTYPQNGSEIDKLIKNAEIALHSAKRAGGNCRQIYSAEGHAIESRKLRLESDFPRAIENSEFEVYYQPQVNLTSGMIVGAEALIRWNHPQEGFISPGEFIPIMEASGWIIPVGDWILINSCKQARIWHSNGFPKMSVSVNLSPRQFSQPNLATRLQQVLDETQLPSKFLEIEITESSIMQDTEATIRILNDLKKTGVRIALDDLGTGFSSLSYLRQFPLDSVKIDQSFIRDVTNNSKHAAIATGIIQMAKNMKLKVVAEGVESFPELFFLYMHQCEEIQGYIFSRPLPVKEFGKLLASGKKLQIHRQ